MPLKAKMFLVERSAASALTRDGIARLRKLKVVLVLLRGLLLPATPLLLDCVDLLLQLIV